jgi:hypothetical protein
MAAFLVKLVLWSFAIALGIALGAGLYESRIVVPQWLPYTEESGHRWDAAAAREANTGLRFWVYVTTVPLTLLTLASLVAPFWIQGEARSWWLGAVLAALLERGMTFAYFIPTMLRLMGDGAIDPSDAVATALQWAHLGYIRHATTLAAWIAALKALTLLGAR